MFELNSTEFILNVSIRCYFETSDTKFLSEFSIVLENIQVFTKQYRTQKVNFRNHPKIVTLR